MYNLALSTLFAAIAFAASALTFTPIAGVFPAVVAFGLSFFLISRRVGRELEVEMKKLEPLLMARKVDEAKALIAELKGKYGNWQPLLSGQLDANAGLIDYMQMKWDDALPQLERGKWRNWMVMVCIGLIHHRQKRPDEARRALADATYVAPSEPMIYLVQTVLLARQGERDEALKAISNGLKQIPGSQLLQDLQSTVANKKKIDTRKFPQNWYQFFPEDAVKHHMMRGQRGGPMPGPNFPQPKMSRKMRRGR